jgi:hypothetical protein
MKNAVCWDVTSCGSCRKLRFIRVTRIGPLGTTLAITSNRSTLRRKNSLLRLLVTSKVPDCRIVNLMMEAVLRSEMSVLSKATRCYIPEDDILHSRHRENLKSYIALTGWNL